jgi:CarD family transcriptional regulator
VGTTLVYPHHGAVTVTDKRVRRVRGEEATYVTMRVHSSDLTIELPAANFGLVGVRDVIGTEGLDQVYAVLRADTVEEAANWSRRYKSNQEKMGSGSVLRVAEVVRDLSRRDALTGVSAGEKHMLQKARQLLESEIALALGSADDAVEAIDAALAEPVNTSSTGPLET